MILDESLNLISTKKTSDDKYFNHVRFDSLAAGWYYIITENKYGFEDVNDFTVRVYSNTKVDIEYITGDAFTELHTKYIYKTLEEGTNSMFYNYQEYKSYDDFGVQIGSFLDY